MNNLIDLKEKFKDLNDNGLMPMPRMIMLETRSKCNGLCSFCPANSLVDNRGDTLMDEDLFDKVLNDLVEMDYSNRLSLYNNNEPFLDNRIYKFISKARKLLPKSYIELKSNGSIISIEKILKAFNAGLDMLYINDYNDFPEHTSNIIKLKKELGQIRRFGENGKEINNFHRIEITIRDRGQILGSRGGKSPNKKDYPVNPYKQSMCFRPSEMMTISPKGDVSICCEDFDWSMAFFNVREKSLAQIWSSKEWSEIRGRLLDGQRDWHQSCKDCDVHGHSYELLREHNIKKPFNTISLFSKIFNKSHNILRKVIDKLRFNSLFRNVKDSRKKKLALIASERKRMALSAQTKICDSEKNNKKLEK